MFIIIIIIIIIIITINNDTIRVPHRAITLDRQHGALRLVSENTESAQCVVGEWMALCSIDGRFATGNILSGLCPQ